MTEIFDKYYPYYLSLGMNSREYWDDDPYLIRVYNKKRNYEIEYQNQILWLQGRYIYDAIAACSPLLNPLVKDHMPRSYVEQPYSLTNSDAEKAEEDKAKAKSEMIKARMQAWAVQPIKKRGR